MSRILAVAGKGGVGKTTFASLLIKYFSDKQGMILAVDADPNANLNQKLGVEVLHTIGDLREEMLKELDEIPKGMSKMEYIQYQIQLAIVEGEKFDLLVMGRPEGPGCYCYVNNLLRTYIDALSQKYRFVIIDNEAGMEHLSRRTTRDVDILFIISDATKQGILTAGRIKRLADSMDLRIRDTKLIINRANEVPDVLEQVVADEGFDGYECIPDDKIIEEQALSEKPLTTLPDNSVAFKAVRKIGEGMSA